MRTGKLLIGLGALGAALTWGCERQQQEGTGGGGIAEQVGQAQEKSKQAYEKAQSAMERAQGEQQQVGQAQQDVAQAQEELAKAEQKAHQESEQAKQAQAQAEQEGQRAEQQAQESQQQTAQAQQEAEQQAQQQREQFAKQQEQEEQQGTAAMGGAGTAGQEKQLHGELQKAQQNSIVVQTDQQGPMTLYLDPNTTVVTIDGQKSSVGQLQEGSDIRASYSIVNNRPTATEIQASSATGQQQQMQPMQQQEQPQQ